MCFVCFMFVQRLSHCGGGGGALQISVIIIIWSFCIDKSMPVFANMYGFHLTSERQTVILQEEKNEQYKLK